MTVFFYQSYLGKGFLIMFEISIAIARRCLCGIGFFLGVEMGSLDTAVLSSLGLLIPYLLFNLETYELETPH